MYSDARASLVIGGERRTGQIRLDAPALSAIALRLRFIARVRPGQWHVPPFAGDRVRTDQRRTAHNDTRACTGAKDHAEHHGRPGRRAVGSLRHGKTVCVVGDANLARETRGQIVTERSSDQPHGVGVLDEARGGGNRPGNPHADGPRPSSTILEAGGERDDGVERCVVVVARRGHPETRDLAAAGKSDSFDFGAAEIDPDSKRHVLLMSGFLTAVASATTGSRAADPA